MRSADILGGNPRPPKGKTFEIRETGNAQLTAGRASGLARTRENVPDVRSAGRDCARLLDFFTIFESDGRSVPLQVAEQPKDAAQRIYEATWAE